MKALRRISIATSIVAMCGFGEMQGRVALVRVHGNHTIPDDDVLRIAGVVAGDAFAAGDAEAVEARLLGSGKFTSADVRVRYRSLSTTGDVALVIVVREKRSVASRIMVAPIVSLSDEYGFTLGATTALVDAGVEGARMAFPLSWGGTREAGFEAQWPLGQRTRHFYAEVSRWRRENPHFDVPENRFELEGGVRARRNRFALELGAGMSDVDFQSRAERFFSLGAGLAFDTRRDPTVPGNAVYAGIDWRRLFFDGSARADVHEMALDLRGYKRLFGQTTLAVQAYHQSASAPLPDYERPFLGGGKTLRGFEAGRFLGDNAALGTLELRVPLTSPLSVVRAGVHGFYDIGAAYEYGRSLRKARFHDAFGVGAFFRFAVVGVRLDVGFDMKGNTRWHIGSGFKF